MRDFVKLSLTVCIILLFAGCGNKNTPKIINYDLPKAITTIDPQFSTDLGQRTIINNVFEGLMKYDENGDISPAAAEKFEISNNGLTYKFTLREDLKWSDGTQITSHDFAFGIKRLFSSFLSPFASEFLSIKNAESIISGKSTSDILGVSTPNYKTLVIELDYANPSFLSLMTHTAAMPCNQQFFLDQKGRYATSVATTLFNGSFTPKKWSKTSIALRPNENYAGQVTSGGVDIFFGRGNCSDLFLQGKSDLCLIPYENISASEGHEYLEFFQNSWSIIFNAKKQELEDPLIRQALISVIDTQPIKELINEPIILTNGIVPPSAVIFDQNYRELAGYPTGAGRLSNPKETLYQQLALLQLTKLSKTTIIVSDIAPNQEIANYIQRQLRDELSVYANLEIVPNDQIGKRLQSGDFQIIIAPSPTISTSAYSYLSPYSTSNGALNYSGYSNPDFDQLLQGVLSTPEPKNAAQKLLQAEQKLIDDYIAMPLFSTPTRLVHQDGVLGVIFSSSTNLIDFRFTLKK